LLRIPRLPLITFKFQLFFSRFAWNLFICCLWPDLICLCFCFSGFKFCNNVFINFELHLFQFNYRWQFSSLCFSFHRCILEFLFLVWSQRIELMIPALLEQFSATIIPFIIKYNCILLWDTELKLLSSVCLQLLLYNTNLLSCWNCTRVDLKDLKISMTLCILQLRRESGYICMFIICLRYSPTDL